MENEQSLEAVHTHAHTHTINSKHIKFDVIKLLCYANNTRQE